MSTVHDVFLQQAEVDNTLLDLNNFSYHTKVKASDCFINYSKDFPLQNMLNSIYYFKVSVLKYFPVGEMKECLFQQIFFK